MTDFSGIIFLFFKGNLGFKCYCNHYQRLRSGSNFEGILIIQAKKKTKKKYERIVAKY